METRQERTSSACKGGLITNTENPHTSSYSTAPDVCAKTGKLSCLKDETNLLLSSSVALATEMHEGR